MAQAIAAYVRTILSGNSPYDRFQAGDRSAMSEAAQRGLRLFEDKAMCVRCHAGFNFTGDGYRNIGIGMDKPIPDLGAQEQTDLVEFMKALSGEIDPAVGRPPVLPK